MSKRNGWVLQLPPPFYVVMPLSPRERTDSEEKKLFLVVRMCAYVCICVRVCVRETKTEKNEHRGRVKERERKRGKENWGRKEEQGRGRE